MSSEAFEISNDEALTIPVHMNAEGSELLGGDTLQGNAWDTDFKSVLTDGKAT